MAATRTWELYEQTTFKSDILQGTHHGLYTSIGGGFDWEYVKKIYDATGAKIAFLPVNSMYPDATDERNGRYTVFVEWSMGWVNRSGDNINTDRCQISYFTNADDVAYLDGMDINNISQSDYEDFVAAVESGTYSGTLFGYDGVNKLYNENGLVTYIATTDLDTMYTCFELGNGAVTLVKNQKVALL